MNVLFGKFGQNISNLIWDTSSSRKAYSKVDEYDDVEEDEDEDEYDEIPGGMMAKLESF